MLEKATYEVKTSKINFPDHVYNTPLDRISIGMFANISKDDGFRMGDYFDKNVTTALTEAELSGIDAIDYLNQPDYDPIAIFRGIR